MTNPDREHVLLTVLGLDPKVATYDLGGEQAESRLAPVALYELLSEEDRPHRVLALCTPQAEERTLPVLRQLMGQDCPVTAVQVPADDTDEAVAAFLTRLAESVPVDAELTVDVTHGLRHMSFLTYVGVLYLTALRQVRLRGAYYGLLRPPPELSVFFDLRPLVELPQWFHALRVLRDTGSAHVVADLVLASGEKDACQVGRALRALSETYGWGLPIELGYLAGRFLTEQVEPLGNVLRAQRLPLADELVGDLVHVLAGQRLRQEVTGEDWKARAALDRAELERLAGIIDGFLARKDYPNAFGLMREWLVLWAMWRTGQERHWLDYYKRKRTENRLTGLRERANGGKPLPPEQATVGVVWGHLQKLRNPYAHHGLDKEVTLSTEGDVPLRAAEVIEVWQTTLRAVPEISLDFPPVRERRVLVSPVGMRPGALFSALGVADPAKVGLLVVVCSATTQAAVDEACQAAGYTGEVAYIRLDDPFAGVKELSRRVDEAAAYLLDASEVYVNVTGGTTLMGVLVEQIAWRARRAERVNGVRRPERPVYRFALIDRRPSLEQETDPYQQGEVCWLDDAPGEERA